ncbi:hypothetical protein ABGB16_32935 [Micromonospora sp. B11E3]|uniref:hypothetical protein n=1 Tax=Micromonospora sp. B11E3 TaxID=3153562 RepID=UPI00325D23D7
MASPILSNIYLDRLDTFVEQTLLPEYHRGDRRRRNRAYQVVIDQIAKARRHGDRAAVRLRRVKLTALAQKRVYCRSRGSGS